MPDKPRTQKELSFLAGYNCRSAISNLLGREGLGAEPEYAKALAELTGTDPFLWMMGGDLAERRRKVEAWLGGGE